MSITHKIIASFGSMDVIKRYDVVPGEMARELDGYYWCTRTNTDVQGPFNSVQDAVRHWTLTRRTLSNYSEATMNQSAWVPAGDVQAEVISLFKGQCKVLDFVPRKRS